MSIRGKKQINHIVSGLISLLKTNLLSVYLHGSLVLDAFDENSSDIDMIGIIDNCLSVTEKIEIGSFLLSSNQMPSPIEVQFIVKDCLIPWQYPSVCHFYFSDYWVLQYKEFLLGESLTHHLLSGNLTDYEKSIATDIKLIKQCGICLYGLPVNDLLPDVPDEHFWDSISYDADNFYVDSADDVQSAFLILTLCRILSYRKTGKLSSKYEAAIWALDILPAMFHPIIVNALYNKYGLGEKTSYTVEDVLLFKSYIIAGIND